MSTRHKTMSEAIKTLKIKILSPNKGKKEALGSTVEIHNSVIAQYIDLTLQHRFLLEVRKESVNKKTGEVCLRPHSNSEILTELEKLSLPTLAHPNTQINIKSLFPGLPTLHRRSCINTSTGMCKSYLSNLKNWESHRKGKPPKPPNARNLPTFYYSTYQLQIFQGEEIPVLSLTGVSKNADDNRSFLRCKRAMLGAMRRNDEQLRYKAFAEGILVKSVNPAFTSRICNKCGGFGERFSHKSLFRCHFCGYCVNADFNASVNLHKVFWEIYPFPRKKKLKPKVACL